MVLALACAGREPARGAVVAGATAPSRRMQDLLGRGASVSQRRIAQAALRRDAREFESALVAGASADDAFVAALDALWPAGLRLAGAAGAKVSGTGALLWMARAACADCVRALLEAGADPNAGPDADALLRAIYEPSAPSDAQTEIVRLLLARGADPNRAASWCEAPLVEAVKRGEAAVAELLLSAGADPGAELRPTVTAGDVVRRMRPDSPGVLIGVCIGADEALLLAQVAPAGVQALVTEVEPEVLDAFLRDGRTADPQLAKLDVATRPPGGVALRRAWEDVPGDFPPPRVAPRGERTIHRVAAGGARVAAVVTVPAQCGGRPGALVADVDLRRDTTWPSSAVLSRCEQLARAAGSSDEPCGPRGTWWVAELGPNRFSARVAELDAPGGARRFGVAVAASLVASSEARVHVAIVPARRR